MGVASIRNMYDRYALYEQKSVHCISYIVQYTSYIVLFKLYTGITAKHNATQDHIPGLVY